MNTCFRFLSIFTAFLFFTLAAAANGTVSGRVTDSSNSPVLEVKVSAENTSNGIRTTAITRGDGLYVFPVLQPGTYRFSFQKAGFRDSVHEGIVLSIGGSVSVDTQLQVGNVEQSITVSGEISPLERESTGLSTVIDRGIIENIPLNGRSFHSLMRLAPGVNLAASSVLSPGQFVVNGMRNSSNYFMVDGVGANFAASGAFTFTQQASGAHPGLTVLGGFNSLVTADALEEFRILTSGYSAEFGRTPGGQIQMRTRAGGNDFHGSVSHYFRNEVMDANEWFANASGQGRAPMRLNQPAFSFGGPVWIPGVYNGKNKTFFHVSYEALRLQQPRFLDAVVPTEEARNLASGQMKDIMNAFPLPNGAALPNDPRYTARYRKNISFPNKHDIPAVRIDHYFSPNVQIFGRWNNAPSSYVSRARANSLTENYAKNRTFTVGLNTSKGRTANELRVNWSTSEAGFNWDIAEVDGAVRPSNDILFPSYTGPDSASSGFNLGPAASSPGFSVGRSIGNYQRQFNIVNNFSWVIGKHQLKFGGDFRRMLPQSRFRTYGISYQFASMEAALNTGINTSTVQFLAPPADVGFNNYSFFANDAWRIHRKLTLTLGLRWEIIPPPSSKERPLFRISQVDDLLTATMAPAGASLFKTRYTDFAPRFGVAYKPFDNSDLTIRAGAGIFYDLNTGQALGSFGYWPYNTVTRTAGNSFPAPPSTLQPTPVNTNPPYDDEFRFTDPNLRLPYSWQWNFSIEKSLGASQFVSANYVGSAGRRLLYAEFYKNQSGLPPVINPVFTESYVYIFKNLASSNYHSLQLQYQRRLARGLQAMANYTFAKSLDNSSDETTFLSPTEKLSPSYFYGPSDFDIRHNVNFAISYSLPFRPQVPVIRQLVSDWGIDGIFSARSASPVNVITGDDPLNIGLTSYVRPNPTGEPIYLHGSQYPGGKVLNRAAFSVPAPGTLGAIGRNIARAHSLRQLDLSVRRNFALGSERFKLQFRADAFNVTNTPNFGNFSGELAVGTFGRSTAMMGRSLGTGGTSGGFNPIFQIGGPRSLQLSLRLNF